ncbi:glycosyltransferase family 2 protein [Pontibacter sp. CAU 1760]
MTHTFAVCILFYQKLEQTIECIESFSYVPGPVKIYVLNNGSDEQSFLKLKSRFHNVDKVVFFDAGENLGPARGRNFLINKVTEPWLVFADNDITVKPENWPELLSSAIASKPQTEIFLPKLFNVHENEYANFLPFHLEGNQVYDTESNHQQTDKEATLNWFPSGASVVKKSFFEEIGNFDANLFAFEDYEMGIRCIMKGRSLNISIIESITFVHDHKYLPNRTDKDAVLQRYNSQKLMKSFEHIELKFGIKLNHDWQTWTNSQVNIMTKSKNYKFIERIINRIHKAIK